MNDLKNLQPMEASANQSKCAKVESEGENWVKTAQGEPVHPEYKKYLDKSQINFRDKINELIEANRVK